MEELRGMADGVGVDITVSFLFTMKEEFSYLVPKKYSYPRENHCSDILLNEENERIIHKFLSCSYDFAQRRWCSC